MKKNIVVVVFGILMVLVTSIFVFKDIMNDSNKTMDMGIEKYTKSNNKDYAESSTIIADSVDKINQSVYGSTNQATGYNNEGSSEYFIQGDFLADNWVSKDELAAMNTNTRYLQKLVDNAKAGQTIKIPSGVYYFTSQGLSGSGYQNYVIKLRDNVHIVGAGVDESWSGGATILKPYAPAKTIRNGLDMFYFNELMDSNGKNPQYVNNISFRNFIIDAEDVRGITYNSAGKGFMINLCRNCSWDNIVVRNTDATGFGMDNVINGSITNSVAMNCGKNADSNSMGASGFGVGTGYSNQESMYISNCKSVGNTKYGFFFEHQNRFNPSFYTATKSAGNVVENSYASGNLYNFGGERANDVIYRNCRSDNKYKSRVATKMDLHFTDQSRRVNVVNFYGANGFSDVIDSTMYYYTPIKWALNNNYIQPDNNKTFGLGQYVTREYAMTVLWRMAGRPGNVLTKSTLSSTNSKVVNIYTPFKDVSRSSDTTSAILWGYNKKIINGMTTDTFAPYSGIRRGDMVLILYRYAGSPKVSGKLPFKDVSKSDYYYNAILWAYKKGIVNGVTNTEFRPANNCTREQLITIYYRFANK